VLTRARRRHVTERAAAIQAALRGGHLAQPAVVTAAYAASARALVAVLTTLNDQITILQGQVEAYFGRHPDAEIILSQPGPGMILGARVLAEFGDGHDRYGTANARKNYAGTSPITRASGRKKAVIARFVHNDRLTVSRYGPWRGCRTLAGSVDRLGFGKIADHFGRGGGGTNEGAFRWRG
jgi:hypothetical protein